MEGTNKRRKAVCGIGWSYERSNEHVEVKHSGGGMAVTDWETKGKGGGRSVNVREKRVGSRNPKVVEITKRWEPLTKGQEPGAQS